MSLAVADPVVLAPLAAIGRAMQEEFDPRRFLEEFSQTIRHIVPHDRLVVDYLDESGRTFTVFAEHAPPGLILHDEHYTTSFAPHARYIVDEWVLRFVFAGEALLIHDFSSHPHFSNANPFHRKMNEKGIRSGLLVPLECCGRVVGALVATRLAAHAYTETHLTALRQIGNVIAPFIENTVLLHRERELRRRLRAVGTLTEVLGTSLDAQNVFGGLAAAVQPILDFDRMAALLIAPMGGT